MGTRRHASESVRTAKAREAPLLPSLPAAGFTQIWLKAGAPAGGRMSNDGSRFCAAHASLDSRVSGDTNLRAGAASFDAKLDALAKLVRTIAITRGHADQALVDGFLAAGWTQENLVDAIVTIGDKTVTTYLHATTRVPVDFPAAPKLDLRDAA